MAGVRDGRVRMSHSLRLRGTKAEYRGNVGGVLPFQTKLPMQKSGCRATGKGARPEGEAGGGKPDSQRPLWRTRAHRAANAKRVM